MQREPHHEQNQAAVLTAAVVAGTALAATPAHALSYCEIGTDRAADARTRNPTDTWSNWSSLGGKWQSGIRVGQLGRGNFEFGISDVGGDGSLWANLFARRPPAPAAGVRRTR
ncbi:hypothetical protein [Streptomyces sp. PsTaAH-124]|uniref:hypothetical protein n=1 Tax=Streptomyces sp. PsTaAH-124 TaxID=1157638 RepID=UPI000371BE34|nr:hypothetical protein [Streptomyces sp. PsTaAH-124]